MPDTAQFQDMVDAFASASAEALGPRQVSNHVERREPRSDTNWIALIRLLDGTEIPCTVKDISKSGAKLGVPSTHTLPETFMLKVVGRDFVLRVRLAWRRGNYAGVLIERIAKLPPPPVEAEAAPTPQQQPDYRTLGTQRSRLRWS